MFREDVWYIGADPDIFEKGCNPQCRTKGGAGQIFAEKLNLQYSKITKFSKERGVLPRHSPLDPPVIYIGGIKNQGRRLSDLSNGYFLFKKARTQKGGVQLHFPLEKIKKQLKIHIKIIAQIIVCCTLKIYVKYAPLSETFVTVRTCETASKIN